MKGEGSHWLTLSTLDCRPRKEVKIYDSASFDTQEVICNLIKYWQPHRENDNISLLVMGADMQGKGETTLVACMQSPMRRPAEISYDERAMREDLFNCFEEECLTMFPHSFPSSVHKKGVKKKSIPHVFCSCKRPENGFYFECTGCKIWFYLKCQDMAQENISDDPQESTYCTACQAQQVGKREEDWIVSTASVSLCLWSTHTSLNSREV